VIGLAHKTDVNTFPFGKKMLVITFQGPAGVLESRVRGLGRQSSIVKFIQSRIAGAKAT
jgi:hypothetical protein